MFYSKTTTMLAIFIAHISVPTFSMSPEDRDGDMHAAFAFNLDNNWQIKALSVYSVTPNRSSYTDLTKTCGGKFIFNVAPLKPHFTQALNLARPGKPSHQEYVEDGKLYTINVTAFAPEHGGGLYAFVEERKQF